MNWIKLSVLVPLLAVQAPMGQLVAEQTQQGSIEPSHFLTGNEILRNCAATSPVMQQAKCNGYIEGVADTLEAVRQANGQPECLPPNIEATQVKDAFLGYLRHHPENRQAGGAVLEILAIAQTWNCQQ